MIFSQYALLLLRHRRRKVQLITSINCFLGYKFFCLGESNKRMLLQGMTKQVYKHVKSKCVIQKWFMKNVDQSGMLLFDFTIINFFRKTYCPIKHYVIISRIVRFSKIDIQYTYTPKENRNIFLEISSTHNFSHNLWR